MLRLPSEKKPLALALIFALIALAVALQWPPTATKDFVWGISILIAAGGLAIYERRLQRQHRGQPMLRWVAAGLATLALLWLILRAG